MSREEFLTELRKALQGRVSQQTVNDNLRYYEEYILTESHKGKTEAEVIAELGNPRLLAKSIIDAENATAEKTTAEPQKGMDGQETASGEYSFKKIKIRIWLILATVFLFVILLIILLAQVVAFLLPVLASGSNHFLFIYSNGYEQKILISKYNKVILI